jgi:hypothetical protein
MVLRLLEVENTQTIHPCSVCGGDSHDNTMGEHYICESCANNYIICDDCGDLTHIDYTHLARVNGDNIYICDGCRDYYWYCEHCETYVATSEWNADRDCCTRCAETINFDELDYRHEEEINNYTYKPKPKFIKGDNEVTKRFYGMEIEIGDQMARNGAEVIYPLLNANGRRAYLKRDGSIRTGGYECVTHPMSSRSLHKWIDKEFTMAKKERGSCWNTDGCGVHIHVSRDSIGKLTLFKLNVLLNMLRGKNNMGFIQFFTNRTPNALNHWAKVSNQLPFTFLESIKNGNGYTYDRYVAVNQQNDKTIEFRIFNGSIDQTVLHSYLEFVECVIDFCVNTPIKDITVGDLFEFMLANTGAYKNLASRLIQQVKDTKTGKIHHELRVPEDCIPDKFDQYFLWTHNYSGTIRSWVCDYAMNNWYLSGNERKVLRGYSELIGNIKVERLKNISNKVEHIILNKLLLRRKVMSWGSGSDDRIIEWLENNGYDIDEYANQLKKLDEQITEERTLVTNKLRNALALERGRTVNREILYKKYYKNDLKAKTELR